MLPDVLGAREPARAQKSGHQKRKAGNSLPTCFLLYVKTPAKAIVGAAIFTECFRVTSGPPEVYWQCSRVVELVAPFALETSMVEFFGSVFRLRPHVEAQVRLCEAKAGGVLAGHFAESEHARIRCFSVQEDAAASLVGVRADRIIRIRTPASYTLSAGVSPSVVAGLPALVQDEPEEWSDEVEKPDAENVDDVEGVGGQAAGNAGHEQVMIARKKGVLQTGVIPDKLFRP